MTTRRFARKRWSAKAFSERAVQTELCESTQIRLCLVLILLAPAHRTRVGEHLTQCSSSQSGSWDLCSSRHSADWKQFFSKTSFYPQCACLDRHESRRDSGLRPRDGV